MVVRRAGKRQLSVVAASRQPGTEAVTWFGGEIGEAVKSQPNSSADLLRADGRQLMTDSHDKNGERLFGHLPSLSDQVCN